MVKLASASDHCRVRRSDVASGAASPPSTDDVLLLLLHYLDSPAVGTGPRCSPFAVCTRQGASVEWRLFGCCIGVGDTVLGSSGVPSCGDVKSAFRQQAAGDQLHRVDVEFVQGRHLIGVRSVQQRLPDVRLIVPAWLDVTIPPIGDAIYIRQR